MFTFLRRRIVLVVSGLVLLSLFIWYAGELFEFNDYRPLYSANARLVAIAGVFVIWIISTLLQQLRANRASDKLVAAVVQQSHKEPPNPEAVRLREQFEDAVAALKQKRRSGHSLYDLPWYVFIGAPGSGKTTALVNSGLNFPLEQRTGKGALRGVGGTRNCDWWFTDEAIFLDTAGRYTTQDSDAASDSVGWVEFLALLKKYRKRRPVNGVILTVSAQDLMVQGLRERESYVTAARRRLDELNRELGIQLPVYLMVTKCDLVAGFAEYFDDLTQEGRAQVWGVTFPYEQTRAGGAGESLPTEFEALMARLNERVFARLDEERDPRRRARIFGFPQQMAALRDTLGQFVSEVFGSTRFDQQILLRGVYFTSGTQEGTPIDRLLGALGRRFAASPEAVATTGGRGKAYFIEHLLKRVLLPESGLAGINRRHEVKKAAVQLGMYAAMIAVAVAGVVTFAVSYNRNKAYIEAVAADVAELQQVPPVSGRSLERLLPRLDAVSRVADSANRFRADGAPWLMRFGLYQGSSLGESARVAYGRELSGALLSQVAARIERRLTEYAPEPERLFEYLKAYLMLANPEHLDKAQLEQIGDLEWSAAYADDPDAAVSASTHFRNLLENRDTLRPISVNETLVTQARNSIRQASIAQLMYRQLRLSYAGADQGAVRLDVASGVGAERVLRRKSGIPLSRPVPALYTAQVFKELTENGTNEIAKRFQQDAWVWGPEGPPETSRTTLQREVNEAYEDDYIAVWDALLKDVDVVSMSSLAMTKDALAILTGPTSPLRGFLMTVDAHTHLVPPEETVKKDGAGLVDFDSILKRGQKAIGISSDKPGVRITRHFAQVHEAVTGEANATKIDAVLKKLEQVKQQLDPIGSEVGATGGGDAAAVNRLGGAVTEAKREAATLTPDVRVVSAVVTQVADRAMGAVREVGRGTLMTSYEQDVLSECRAIVGSNYPFVPGSVNDVPLADFGRLFGYGGIYDTFFKSHLEPLVDTTRQTWTWREDATGAAVGGTVTMLRQFEMAQRIRRRFFRLGATVPEVSFEVTPVELDDRASRFVLEINGQRIEDRHVATRPVTVRWPGEGVGEAAVTFESRSGPRVGRTFKGPWAWFRLLATADLAEEGESVRYALTFRQDGLSAVVGIDSLSVNHPFSSNDLQNFQCR